MSNIPKPDLEHGNFIAYADEPNTIVSGSGGGGGAVFLPADYDESMIIVPDFTYNQVKRAIDADVPVYAKASFDNKGEGETDHYPVTGYSFATEDDVTTYNAYLINPGGERVTLTASDPDKLMTVDN